MTKDDDTTMDHNKVGGGAVWSQQQDSATNVGEGSSALTSSRIDVVQQRSGYKVQQGAAADLKEKDNNERSFKGGAVGDNGGNCNDGVVDDDAEMGKNKGMHNPKHSQSNDHLPSKQLSGTLNPKEKQVSNDN